MVEEGGRGSLYDTDFLATIGTMTAAVDEIVEVVEEGPPFSSWDGM